MKRRRWHGAFSFGVTVTTESRRRRHSSPLYCLSTAMRSQEITYMNSTFVRVIPSNARNMLELTGEGEYSDLRVVRRFRSGRGYYGVPVPRLRGPRRGRHLLRPTKSASAAAVPGVIDTLSGG